MLRERWLLWKAGLYDLEVVSLWGRYFWTGGLAYDNNETSYSTYFFIEYWWPDHLSYASPPIQKLYLHSDIISQPYKSAFHSSHLSHNMSHGGDATIQVFCSP